MAAILKGLPADTYQKIAGDLTSLPESAESRAKKSRQVHRSYAAGADALQKELESLRIKLAREASATASLQRELLEKKAELLQNKELAAKHASASASLRLELAELRQQKEDVAKQWQRDKLRLQNQLAEERRRGEDLAEQLRISCAAAATAAAAREREEESTSRLTATTQAPLQLWEVVGGKRDGIFVREGQDLASPESRPSRLFSGAVVKQLELVGVRLQFELVTGKGPTSGWVTIKASGKDLLVRRPSLAAACEGASAVDEEHCSSAAGDSAGLEPSSPSRRTTRTAASPGCTEHFVLSPEKKRKHTACEGGSSGSVSEDESCCAAGSEDTDGEPTGVPASSVFATVSCCPTPPNDWSLEDPEAACDSQSNDDRVPSARLASPAVGVLYDSGPEAEIKMLMAVVRDLERQLKHAQQRAR
eukprot:TRINITY_DN61796_c0_g1_i1.p1 TRINITY_DN61796_c0_g1~~TRINITY_DN61796_c0_g1_i1.p1  ORF type:complete len:428 (-),score=108.66 TRINITY_DN61796_c0_g1_i1:21-1283(-)